jgi:hypothetical protein
VYHNPIADRPLPIVAGAGMPCGEANDLRRIRVDERSRPQRGVMKNAHFFPEASLLA